MKLCAIGVVVATLAACSDSTPKADTAHSRTIVVALTKGPSTLFPPLITDVPSREIGEQIYDYLLVVDPDLNWRDDGKFEPRLAESWTWSPDSLSIAFHINPNARWHDGERADARDVRFTYEVYTSPEIASPSASELVSVDSVTVSDSLTAVFWYHSRSMHQLLDASEMMIMPRHVLGNVQLKSLTEFASTAKPVGTGRFRFQRWEQNSFVDLDADIRNYRGAAKVDRVVWSIAPNSDAAATKFLGGEADVFPALRREGIAEVSRHPKLRALSFPSTEYTYLGFNLARPLFASRELRRALTMVVDRAAIVKNIFDTLAEPGVGPTVRAFPTTDAAALKQIPFDLERGKKTLEALGWHLDPTTGYRKKGTQDLRFSTIVASTSTVRKGMATLLQAQFRAAGVRMDVETMDFPVFSDRQSSRKFDAAIANSLLGATPTSIRELWGGESARKNGSNYSAYENPVFDAEVDSGLGARQLSDSKKHFTKAYQIIIDDAPAIWISDQKTVVGLTRRLHPGVMRADSWWFDLADWSFSSPER
ncbi:MAG TPA: peptide ABC transporter substrate-binding protein [Gemmatimonadaceae bacterium]|nr:peptide ABC transporter substrate-binding protein [Gemmatimonadaceae bacterium]